MEGVKLIFQLIFGLILFVGILYLSYIATKGISKKLSINGRGGKNLKIIESVSVGRESSMLLVKAGEKVLVVGATSHSLTLISELTPDEITEEDASLLSGTGNTMDFSEALKINISKLLNKDNSRKVHEEDKNDKKHDS